MKKLMLCLTLGAWVPLVIAGGRAALPAEAAVAAPSETRAVRPAGQILWRASVTALTVANVADVSSSWGKRELNPALSGSNGRFGAQGALLKLGIVSGMFVVESIVLRHHPSAKFYRGLALVNFGSASVTGATAIRNFGIPR